MGVQSLFFADQLKAIVQAEGLANELNAPGFAPVADMIAKNTRLQPAIWVSRMRGCTGKARTLWAGRESVDREYNADNAAVRDDVDGSNDWREVVGAAVDFAVATHVPGAVEASRKLAHVAADVDSYENQAAELIAICNVLEGLDPSVLDLSPEFIAEGRALAAKMIDGRVDVDESKIDRAVKTDDLALVLLDIANLAEELYAARALTQARTRRELPGFDLTYIRAAAAAHRAPAPTTPAAATTDAEARGL